MAAPSASSKKATECEEAASPEPPVYTVFPPFRRWRQVYALVLAWLAVLMAAFYAFTQYFGP
jgi:hypothetical protein